VYIHLAIGWPFPGSGLFLAEFIVIFVGLSLGHDQMLSAASFASDAQLRGLCDQNILEAVLALFLWMDVQIEFIQRAHSLESILFSSLLVLDLFEAG
jgi:hypothetical protein